jgi:SAM-dependent methyltransferase
VLNIGYGRGQKALPLTRYLNNEYEGFDVNSREIEWATRNISPKYPNFHFQFIDIYNKSYNPKGKYRASEYKFPYSNESFDFVFLISVFTHMLPQSMENYLSEIVRVLKKGGMTFASYFLLNEVSLKFCDTNLDAKSTHIDFKYNFGNYRVAFKDNSAHAIAYSEKYIRRLYDRYGLKIVEPIRYGSWCGRKKFFEFQDIIIASKMR